MTGKELVLTALRNGATPRPPWVPFVGCHAAMLLGVPTQEYFASADLIVAGARKAAELYRPDGLPVLFDLQVEAEALGCRLRYSDQNPPAVMSHPLEEGVNLSDLKVPDGSEGRFPQVLEAARRISAELGGGIAVYGLVTGPFTLALHLMGTDIFFEMADNPGRVSEVMAFCQRVCAAAAALYIDAGVDVVAVVDPMVSQISPASFEDFVQPYATAVFDFIKSRGRGASFFVCGNAKRNIELMCRCRPHNLSFDENIPMAYVKDIASRHGVSIGGNIQLTVTMLLGTPEDNIRDAANCCALGGTSGFILSPGCDMPFAVPPVNVQAIAAFVHGEEASFLLAHGGGQAAREPWDKPDYPALPYVTVDVVTLDSESCAPCQYMMEAVAAAARGLGDKVRFIEHKIKDPASLSCMTALGATNIPTICIDGQVRHVSLIPKPEDLRAEILAALADKGL